MSEALVGRFSEHRAFVCRTMLDRIDAAEATITSLTTRIEQEIAPFQVIVERLDTIPGVSARIAQVLVAETGADMSRFPTAAHLASWAGMCPGNHESASKHHGGTTRKGDSWLRGAIGEAALRPPAPTTPICKPATAGWLAAAARNEPSSLLATASSPPPGT